MTGKQNTRRGFTHIKRAGQALPDNAPTNGHPAAFTLIELLVVVLIIGILAAVALPQYQFAIAKSRTVAMMPLGKSMADAEGEYFLAHGSYTSNANNLNFKMPSSCTASSDNGKEWKCGKYFFVHFPVDPWEAVLISYCPDYNTDWDTCSSKRDFHIAWPFAEATKPHQWTCTVDNSSALGRKICSKMFPKN